MDILSGGLVIMEEQPDRPPLLLSRSPIAEGMGYRLDVEVDLTSVLGEVDNTGRICLDFSRLRTARCNLVPEPTGQGRLGARLLQHVEAQPGYKRSYVLGAVDLSGGGSLCPVSFSLLTQPAPGAKDARSANYGDGAVLLFMQLRTSEEAGALPVEASDFPYLIPDDAENGESLYSAALVVAEDVLGLVTEEQIAALANGLLPDGFRFVQGKDGRHQPFDLALFGNVAADPGSVVVEPRVTSVPMGKTRQFTARRGDGSAISGAEWSATCLVNPLSVGRVTQSGAYMAGGLPAAGCNVLPVAVTASYRENGRVRTSSALVLTRLEPLTVAPLAALREAGGGPLELAASATDGAVLHWRLVEPSLGRLQTLDGGRAVYTPPDRLDGESLAVQRIEVRDAATGNTVQASVILLAGIQTIRVEPPYVTAFVGGTAVRLEVSPEYAEGGHWRVLGDGSMPDGDGVLHLPAEMPVSPVSVVVFEWTFEDLTFRGFSVVEFSPPREQEIPRWTNLQDFSVTVQGDPAPVFANGMQQVPLLVRIETQPVKWDGLDWDVPISDVEMARLQLVDKFTRHEIPFIDPAQEGIEQDSPVQWAVRERPNRFRHFNSLRRQPPRAENGRTRYRELYLHVAGQGVREFYAQFQADDGMTWRSLDHSNNANTVRVQGLAVPARPADAYELTRARVWNGAGEQLPDDPFSYVLESTDFWTLSYKRNGLPVGFSALRIAGSASSVQWESEQLAEIFFSYTGYAFNPILHDGSAEEPKKLSFDPYLTALMKAVSHADMDPDFHGSPPGPGQLVVSLHRIADMPYWHDSMAGGNPTRMFRQQLDPAVTYVLLDEEGNRHRLRIGFADKSIADSRNLLKLYLG